jgi:hypothetical protein
MLRPRCDYALVLQRRAFLGRPRHRLGADGGRMPATGNGARFEGGAAWDHLPHDHARSRAYRWGEDAIGGYSDEGQRWCLGVALCANDGRETAGP